MLPALVLIALLFSRQELRCAYWKSTRPRSNPTSCARSISTQYSRLRQYYVTIIGEITVWHVNKTKHAPQPLIEQIQLINESAMLFNITDLKTRHPLTPSDPRINKFDIFSLLFHFFGSEQFVLF